jgi:hypothetical protein
MKLIPFFLLLFVGVHVYAQEPDLDHLMTRRFLHCADIAVNCKTLIPKYHENGRQDSVSIVLAYWRNRCGETNDVRNTQILLQISENRFNEAEIKGDLLGLLLSYKSEIENVSETSDFFQNEQDKRWLGLHESYYNFIKYFAAQLKERTNKNSLEYFICDFYGQNFEALLSALKENALPGTLLQQNFNTRKANLDNLIEGNIGVLAEYWIPTGNARTLGNHPGLGMQVGLKRRNLTADITLMFRFMKSSNPYSIYENDSLYTTNNFSSMYAGFEIGNVVYSRKRYDFSILGGIANDAITAVPGDEEKDIASIGINALNLNFGAGYRHYFGNPARYVGIQVRYNVVDYFTRGGSDLSGNTLSVRFVAGWSRNTSRDYFLRQLGY